MSRKKLLLKDVTIGADIEVFLKDISSDEIVSAEGIIKGTKDEPFRFKPENDYFGTSLDNVMAEFCIPPVTTGNDFYRNIQEALSYIKSDIPKELDIFAFPCANVDEKYLQTENAQLFGCDPDFNAWLFGNLNPKPEATNGTLRSCGGHIHIGYRKPSQDLSMQLVKAMDIFVGLPSVIQEPDNQRKMLYGKAGAFRFKPYGVEYRTVSNYYIASENLTKWAFTNTMEAIKFINDGNVINEQESDAIRTAINAGDKELAETMCKYFNVKLAA
jgi:hypothetical protein